MTVAAGAAVDVPSRRRGLVLAVLLSAWFLAQFDFFVVNVAAPSLGRGLDADATALELIVGGYAFTYASGMVTGGRLGDRFGHRRVFVAGVAAFTVASLLCGLSAGPRQLIVARLVQGLAGAVMVPQVLAVITITHPGEARARALGWYGVAGGLGSIAGQVLGGLLLRADVLGLGWRVIFLVNVPVGVVAVVLAHRLLPRTGAGGSGRQDPVGAVGLAVTLALVMVPLTLGHGQGWPVWTWVCLVSGVPAGWLTVVWLRRLHARGGAPVVDPTLMYRRSYRAGLGAVVAFMAYFASLMFTLTLLLQDGLGLDAFGAGLTFAPMGVLFAVASALGPRVPARHGVRAAACGAVLTGVGLSLLIVCLHIAGERTALGWIVAALALVGVGNGLTLPRLIGLGLVDVEAERAGIGAAVLTTAQQFAAAGGVAVVGSAFFAIVPHGGAARAMRWTALADLVLIALVFLLLVLSARRSRHRPHSTWRSRPCAPSPSEPVDSPFRGSGSAA